MRNFNISTTFCTLYDDEAPPAPLRNKFFLREVLLRKTLAAALRLIIASLAVIPVKASALVAEIADVFDVLYLAWR